MTISKPQTSAVPEFCHDCGKYRVAILCSDGLIAISDPNRYASEASATIAAKKAHFERPHMNYIVVRE